MTPGDLRDREPKPEERDCTTCDAKAGDPKCYGGVEHGRKPLNYLHASRRKVRKGIF